MEAPKVAYYSASGKRGHRFSGWQTRAELTGESFMRRNQVARRRLATKLGSSSSSSSERARAQTQTAAAD